MSTVPTHSSIPAASIICTVVALIAPWSLVHADKAIQDRRAADPQGMVEIVNVSGTVEVDGWDRSEVEVGGTAGNSVDRVDVASVANRTTIRVVPRSSHTWNSDGETHLIVHVPAKSSVTASLVSSDFKVNGLVGDLKVQSVSGNITGDTGGDVHATAVSGALKLTARAVKSIEIKSISGDIKNCFGPKPMESHYGPGSRLQFTNGDGRARVRISTKSGAVSLCSKGASGKRVMAVSLARVCSVGQVLPYVY